MVHLGIKQCVLPVPKQSSSIHCVVFLALEGEQCGCDKQQMLEKMTQDKTPGRMKMDRRRM